MKYSTKTRIPDGDYVSKGLEIVIPDKHFSNLVKGNTNDCPWPYLRRNIPHNWYIDKRILHAGFLSRDEVHIAYNTALQFKNMKALEIGCWMGWSTCHLAMSGVKLDVIDPLLNSSPHAESVRSSLESAGVLDTVNLVAGKSPDAIEKLATDNEGPWSFIFIDGDHENQGPLVDAKTCSKHAAADAIILFHDLASPHVAQGLDYLNTEGWNTQVYQTMQIMGVAWRGNVKPLIHHPDPTVKWDKPDHLSSYSTTPKLESHHD